ncbi:hypothetical protein FRB96_004568 [Tulasnella sp. 330]|nr:hypothetical protein FRB96_004568 [Tulasnella sp. 330]
MPSSKVSLKRKVSAYEEAPTEDEDLISLNDTDNFSALDKLVHGPETRDYRVMSSDPAQEDAKCATPAILVDDEVEVITPALKQPTRKVRPDKRSKAKAWTKKEPQVPSPAQFEQMTEKYYLCEASSPALSVLLSTHSSDSIVTGIFIRPGNKKEPKKGWGVHELWKARILAIKEDKTGYTWLKVRWFYSQGDLRAPHGAKPPPDYFLRSIGKNEIVDSYHEDIVPYESCEATVEILFFKDGDITLDNPISFYYRSRIRFVQTTGVCKLEVAPGTCFETGAGNRQCSKTYNPDQDVQHFCATCDRWYHVDCMRRERWGPWLASEVKKKFGRSALSLIEKVTASGQHEVKLRGTFEIEKNDPPKKKTRASDPKSICPPEIRAVAQMQILRGTGAGGARYGVAGNAKLVCGARLLLEDFTTGDRLTSRKDLKQDWLHDIKKEPKPKTDDFYKCGRCDSLI